ncbi:type II toxin-antitoxin system PemK/MazF family toxin [Brevundimonas sp.]|jgi:hypothetical protein|uniref:type II toxin-antitoxin system PemK/MazF family toxin n=1 Tax=Brevundimonas sp. TaxID=1871086 RepID=UPI00391D7453
MATPSSTDPRQPERGDVIEFSFLWAHEYAAGETEGRKDRRCVIVAILDGGSRVIVAPITGTEPQHSNKIPLSGGQVGLARPSWIVTDQLNVTIWPGHDLRPASVPNGAWWRHGRISDAKRALLADAVEALMRERLVSLVPREAD